MGMSIFDGAIRAIGNPSQPGPTPGGPFTPRPDLGPGVGFGPGLPDAPAVDEQGNPLTPEQAQFVDGIGNVITGVAGPGYGMLKNMDRATNPDEFGNAIADGSMKMMENVAGGLGKALGVPGGKGGFAGPSYGIAPDFKPVVSAFGRNIGNTIGQLSQNQQPGATMGGIRGRDLSGNPNGGQLMGGMGNFVTQPPAQQNRFMPRGIVPPAGFRPNPRQINVRGRR